MIAPSSVRFYDSEWNPRTTKHEDADLLSQITGVDYRVLNGDVLPQAKSAGERMSWASQRETTRPEDIAYCLLGIFDINMPLLYGEGGKAFLRLQEVFLGKNADLSLLRWEAPREYPRFSGAFAPSPSFFLGFDPTYQNIAVEDLSVTNRGIRIKTGLRLEQLSTDWSASPNLCLALAARYEGTGNAERRILLRLLRHDRHEYLRDNDMSGGLWSPDPNIAFTIIPTCVVYLGHDLRADINLLRYRSDDHIRMVIGNNLRVFDTAPSIHWDRLEDWDNNLILLGPSNAAYGCILILSLIRGISHHAFYLLPATSPAIPYIFGKLSNLTGEELSKYWGIRPEMVMGLDIPSAQALYRTDHGDLTLLWNVSSHRKTLTINYVSTRSAQEISQDPPLNVLTWFQLSRLSEGL